MNITSKFTPSQSKPSPPRVATSSAQSAKDTFTPCKEDLQTLRYEEKRYRELLEEERAKPGWADSQARQAWLHWG